MLIQNSEHALNRFMTTTTWASICLFVISLAVYHVTIYNEFVWDSINYLSFNELWVSNFRPEHLIWMFVTTDMSNWHPLTWLSWAIDYQFYGGLNPEGFHFTNNVLHGVCSTLVYVLGLKIFLLNANENSNKTLPNSVQLGAMGAALLFAVHPQHVESVAWVAERKDLLCFLFSMLSLIKYLDYGMARDNKTRKHLQLSVFFFVLAGLSKPMAVTIPALLLVLDFFPLQRTPWNTESPHSKTSSLSALLQEKWPFFSIGFRPDLSHLIGPANSVEGGTFLGPSV